MEINVGAGTLYGTKQAAPQHFNSDYSSPFHSSIKPYNALHSGIFGIGRLCYLSTKRPMEKMSADATC